MKSILISLFLILLSLGQAFGLEIPALSGPVVDQARLYTSKEIEILSELSQQLLQKGGPQFQILVIDSLEGEPIESFSIKVTDKWKLGDEKKDNGLLLVIAKNDRKMRIEVGQGLEGDITDYETSLYINKLLKPAFKQQQYFEGTAMVVLKVAEKFNIQLEQKQQTHFTRSPKRGSTYPHVIILIIIIIIFFFMNGSGGPRFGRSSYYGGGYYGGGYRSRSSGSSWGGGGGGFSGGGASGDW